MLRVVLRRWLYIVAAVLAVAPVAAGTISLTWDAASGASGYRVYWGASPGVYGQNPKDVGNVTETTIDDLTDCTTWYLAVKAYNAAGESPDYSNEVVGWARPVVGTPSISVALQRVQATLRISGANFQQGATIQIESDNPRVYFETPQVVAGRCDAIDVALSVAPTYGQDLPALAGTFNYTVTVTNPDGVYRTQAEQLEIQVDPARFNISTAEAATRIRLDEADLGMFSRLFGSTDGDDRYDPAADFDGDLTIDGNDLALAFGTGLTGKCWNGTTYTIAACPPELK